MHGAVSSVGASRKLANRKADVTTVSARRTPRPNAGLVPDSNVASSSMHCSPNCLRGEIERTPTIATATSLVAASRLQREQICPLTHGCPVPPRTGLEGSSPRVALQLELSRRLLRNQTLLLSRCRRIPCFLRSVIPSQSRRSATLSASHLVVTLSANPHASIRLRRRPSQGIQCHRSMTHRFRINLHALLDNAASTRCPLMYLGVRRRLRGRNSSYV